ncbi:MAG: bifunctional histidinol-phosphatase/imidazoleglycerol-phosphate dehydratase HisB [Candidatus Neomarinimicrobiota bacterium]
MKKVLFIDRDGTLIVEPPDEQVDSLEKLEFVPGAITAMQKIAVELDFKLVMVTNQDGLGTSAFPEKDFWPAHNKMLKILAGEGVVFDEILIDRSLPADNAPTRKPRIGLLTEYLKGDYDLANSWVIGDRAADVQLARNLGAKAIYLGADVAVAADFSACNWQEIYEFLADADRTATIERKTNETDIRLQIRLNSRGVTQIDTGIGFLDHMLNLFAAHSGCDLELTAKGDLTVDEHHTVEDIALVLGTGILQALGDKKGIERYGFLLPMDESLAQVALDFSGRREFVWECKFKREYVGQMPTELVRHFFKSFADAAACNLHIKATGENEHHKIEAIFKAVGRSVKMAVRRDPANRQIPSTKGVL